MSHRRHTGARQRIAAHVCIAAALALLFWPRPGWTQDAPACPDPGAITPEAQEKAQALLHRAFELHTEMRYEETGETYRQALRYSPDPRIHLQAGIAFLSALRLLDAHEHLTQALRCGRGVIPESELEDAERMLARLRERLGEVEVHCHEPGAKVRFNDAEWFTCAGQKTRVVMAGQYLIAVDKPGFVRVFTPVDVAAGQRVRVEPKLMSTHEATRVTRPFRPWQPWAVAGAGALFAVVGGGLEWHARTGLDAYQRDLEALCAPSCSIEEQSALQARYRRVTLENRLAVSALVLGGTALAAGVAAAFFNQPRTSLHPDAGRARIQVVPMVSEHGAGIRVGHRF